MLHTLTYSNVFTHFSILFSGAESVATLVAIKNGMILQTHTESDAAVLTSKKGATVYTEDNVQQVIDRTFEHAISQHPLNSWPHL